VSLTPSVRTGQSPHESCSDGQLDSGRHLHRFLRLHNLRGGDRHREWLQSSTTSWKSQSLDTDGTHPHTVVIASVPQVARFYVVVLTAKQWTFDPSTQELTAQWVNPAGDSLAAEIGFDPGT
jgi:hypothetical protein